MIEIVPEKVRMAANVPCPGCRDGEPIGFEFAYAYQPTPDDLPEIQRAVEYSAVNGDKVYAVSVHGPEARVAEMESTILATVSLK